MEKTASPITRESILLITSAISDLLLSHSEGIDKVIGETFDRKLSVSIGLAIDCADKSPNIDIKLAYTPAKVSDCRSIQFEDPDQRTLDFDDQSEPARIVSGSRGDAVPTVDFSSTIPATTEQLIDIVAKNKKKKKKPELFTS